MQTVTPPPSITWRLFAGEDLPDGLFDHRETVGNTLELPDGRVIEARDFAFPESGVADMWSVLGYRPKPLSRTILVADFEDPEAAKRIIGFGCDWESELHLNGEKLLSLRGLGNGENHVNPYNHLLEIQTRKGHNQLIYELFGGIASFDAAFQFMLIPPLELKFQPWVSFPDAAYGTVTVTFSANRPTPAGVDIRKHGETRWTRVYDDLGGQIRRDRAEHAVRLENLEPDSDYEYRAVLLDECRGMYEYALPEVYHFRTAPASGKPFSFITTSDLQLPFAERVSYLQTLMARRESRAADFFAFLGDVMWTSDFDQDVIAGLVEPFQRATDFDKMLVIARGNHEIYGQDSNRFFTYFNAPEPGREGYTMFRWGEVCFFVLDFCDNAGREPQPPRHLHDFEPYLAHEAAWLRRIVGTPECQSARYRIVLAHGIPLGDLKKYLPGHVRQVIDPVFGGEHPQCRIHLWLGGHVHYPLRSIPGKNAWYTLYDLATVRKDPSPPPLGENYSFTVAVHSGPDKKRNPANLQASSMLVKISDSGIEVQSFDMEGTCYDHFLVHEDGSVKNINRADWFRRFDY